MGVTSGWMMVMWIIVLTHPEHVRKEARCQGACGDVL